MKHGLMVGLAFGVVLSTGTVAAQELGEQGVIVIGADRVAGVFANKIHAEVEQTQGGTTMKFESEAKITQFAVLGHASDAPHTVPRLALDVFVTEGLSVGGSLVYLRRTGEQEEKETVGDQTDSETQDLATETALVIAPRLGYALPIGEGAFFWPRGGFSYTRTTTENEREDRDNDSTYTETDIYSYTNVSLEANFVLSPVENFGFLIGAFYDVPLGGSSTTEYDPSRYEPENASPDPDIKVSTYGLQAGLVGWF